MIKKLQSFYTTLFFCYLLLRGETTIYPADLGHTPWTWIEMWQLAPSRPGKCAAKVNRGMTSHTSWDGMHMVVGMGIWQGKIWGDGWSYMFAAVLLSLSFYKFYWWNTSRTNQWTMMLESAFKMAGISKWEPAIKPHSALGVPCIWIRCYKMYVRHYSPKLMHALLKY